MTRAVRERWLAAALDRLGRPCFGVLGACESERLPGESLFDTAHRVLLAEALMIERGSQADAADHLGVSPRMMNYYLAQHSVQPKQLKLRAVKGAA